MDYLFALWDRLKAPAPKIANFIVVFFGFTEAVAALLHTLEYLPEWAIGPVKAYYFIGSIVMIVARSRNIKAPCVQEHNEGELDRIKEGGQDVG